MPTHWTCPFCNRLTTLNSQDTNQGDAFLFDNTKYSSVGLTWVSARCPNPNCLEVWLRVGFSEYEYVMGQARPKTERKSWMLRPDTNAKPLPEYIPKPIKEDYYEACMILEKSPKASATLSRRCLQGMIRDFWGIKEKTLYAEINKLEKRIDSSTWKSIDSVRQVGNIGAHMEADINHIVPVEPEEAQLLVGMIEQLIGDWYVQRHEREQRSKRIIELAEEKKQLKNKTSKPKKS